MIIFILKMIFLTTLWTVMWKIATAEGMIFEKIGLWGEKKVEQGEKVFDALIVCPFCIPNIHGILIVWPLAFIMGIMPFEFKWEYLSAYPFCLGGSSMASGFIWTWYATLNRKKDYYEKAEEKAHLEVKTMKENYFKSKNRTQE